jgi:uncharacterized protein
MDPTIIFGMLIFFLGGATIGLTGFGFALVAVPLLSLLLSPKIVVPIVVVLDLFILVWLTYRNRKFIEFKRVLPILIAGVIGLPIGTYALISLNTDILRILVGAIIALFAIALLIGFEKKVKHELRALLPLGIISGMLAGSVKMPGPPIILFLENQHTDKRHFRADLISYFTLLSIFTIPMFFIGGLITKEVITYASYFLIPMILGTFLGIKFVNKFNEELFRKVVLVLVTIVGILAIITGLGTYF